MRISVDPNDAGHIAYASLIGRGIYPRVVLDGVEQKKVITADEGMGIVLRHVLDAQGRSQIDPANMQLVWVEEVAGKVEVLLSEG